MESDNYLQQAMQLLAAEDRTCAIVGNGQIYTSTARGIRPLLECYHEQNLQKGCSAADKVVGKAAAFVYVLLGIRELYAKIISRPAYEVLENAGIQVCYDKMVEAIKNRAGNGYCPMERAVWEIKEPQEALAAVELYYEAITNRR